MKKLIYKYIEWRAEDIDRIINDKYGIDSRFYDSFMLIPDVLMMDFIIKWATTDNSDFKTASPKLKHS